MRRISCRSGDGPGAGDVFRGSFSKGAWGKLMGLIFFKDGLSSILVVSPALLASFGFVGELPKFELIQSTFLLLKRPSALARYHVRWEA
jgi:hypothetical protein